MANVQGLVSVQTVDYLGVTVSAPLPVLMSDTTTIAQLVTAVQGYAAVYDDITGPQITALSCSLSVTLPGGLKQTPTAGDENEKTGLFNYRQTGSAYKYGVDVPGIAETMIVNGKINLADAAIEAFDAWLKIAHSQVQAVSKYGLFLASLADALISFRKHRKAENRRSVELGS